MKAMGCNNLSCRLILVATLVVAGAVAGASKPWPSASHTRSSKASATQSVSRALCSENAVQCCADVVHSNSTTATSILSRLSVVVPKNVDIGYNCTTLSDEDVSGGSCDNSVVCCQTVYNATVGVNCTDIAVAP
ncbi:hypothetical protein DFH11DRAFT_969482 [Phellopilus nigrolimitatus]|nr:hypothetical protein DFH11DRAFT_969482 [Phellopilus nigrolimitatus]